MKKVLGIMLIGLFLMCGNAFGAEGTVTDNAANGVWPSQNNGKNFQVIMSWTDGDLSLPATATTMPINAYVTRVETNPGTAPTDNYDITLTNANGVDVMGGTLANRDSSTSEAARPYDSASGTYGDVYVAGTLTLYLSGNSEVGATGTVTIYCERP